MNKCFWAAVCLVLLVAVPGLAANFGMTEGTPDVKSAGPLAFSVMP